MHESRPRQRGSPTPPGDAQAPPLNRQTKDDGPIDMEEATRPGRFRFKKKRRFSMEDPLDASLYSKRSRRRSRGGRNEEGEEDGRSTKDASGRHPGDDGDGDGGDGDGSRREDRHGSSNSRHHRGHRDHRDHDHHSSSKQHHRRRRRRDHNHPPEKEKEGGEAEPEDPFAAPLDPDAAFRESLFDAMADDEGAAYWQGVYGQPIHTYASELEGMGEEDYAAHVRRRMWEKTHPGVVEERERRRARREEEEARRRERAGRHRRESGRVRDEVDRSLRRGQARRRRRAWRSRFDGYRVAWGGVSDNTTPTPTTTTPTTTTTTTTTTTIAAGAAGSAGAGAGAGGSGQAAADGLLDARGGPAWPVESGLRADIGEAAIREFFICGLGLDDDDDDDDDADESRKGSKGGKDQDLPTKRKAELAAVLKNERVRWHPDKVQQRLGARARTEEGEGVMRDVTAVFQVVDKLWGIYRPRS